MADPNLVIFAKSELQNGMQSADEVQLQQSGHGFAVLNLYTKLKYIYIYIHYIYTYILRIIMPWARDTKIARLCRSERMPQSTFSAEGALLEGYSQVVPHAPDTMPSRMKRRK